MANISDKTIAEKVNALEQRRTLLRSEIDNPPEKVNAYYFSDRESEVRTLTLMIDAVKDLLK